VSPQEPFNESMSLHDAARRRSRVRKSRICSTAVSRGWDTPRVYYDIWIGQEVPGVTITVSADDVERTIYSDKAGCYEFTDLPRGSYVLFARLLAFTSVTRDQVEIVPGRGVRFDFEMRVHSICECAGPPSTVASLWEEADAVVRLRITGHGPGPDRWSNPVLQRLPDIKHTATVLSVLKPHPMAAAATLAFLQPQQYPELEPYAVGQEFVVFLRWLPTWDAFERMHANLGGAAAFAIKNGQIRSAGILGSYAGMSVDAFLTELRALSQR
jgi:hypothetical protein